MHATLGINKITNTQYQKHISPLLILLCGLLLNSLALASLPLADSQNNKLPTLAPLVKKAKPAVVNISVKSTQNINNPLMNDPFFRRFFKLPKNLPQQRESSSAGSGVIIDAEKGTVITNYHVIKNADAIHISLVDGRRFEAKLIGSDPDVDIAVLAIEADNLQALPIADSSQLEVGDYAIAIGNPFGLNHTVTTGIVSALERSGLGIEGYENFIQTDASINPGNSGGALINLRGELIGINTAIIAPSGGNVGIGFAIPSNMAINSSEQILEHGEVKRGRLGIYIQDMNPALAEAFDLDKQQRGVLVTKVEDNSPAKSAGLKDEDIIIAVNGKSIKNAQELRNSIGLARIGDTVKVEFLRKGKKKTLKIKVKDFKHSDTVSGKLPEQLEGAEFLATADGLIISAIAPGSKAEQSGLQQNDLIIEANRQRIRTQADLAKLESSDKLLLRIVRQGRIFYLVLR